MIGVCKYCGQTRATEAENKMEADKYAAENCDCVQARQERELTRRIESAKERLIELVGDDCEKYGFEPIEDGRTIDFLKQLIERVARSDMNVASISLVGNTRITIKKGSKGQLKVGRSESRSYEMKE